MPMTQPGTCAPPPISPSPSQLTLRISEKTPLRSESLILKRNIFASVQNATSVTLEKNARGTPPGDIIFVLCFSEAKHGVRDGVLNLFEEP